MQKIQVQQTFFTSFTFKPYLIPLLESLVAKKKPCDILHPMNLESQFEHPIVYNFCKNYFCSFYSLLFLL